MKSPKKKAAMMKRARSGVKGLIATWIDPDPMSSGGTAFSEMAVTHRNPVWKLAAADVLRNHGDWIIAGAEFRWLINIEVVFDYPIGVRQIEEREPEAWTTLEDINDHCFEHIQDARRHGDMAHYAYTRFRIECIEL